MNVLLSVLPLSWEFSGSFGLSLFVTVALFRAFAGNVGS